jgi:hypothetical protein
LEEGSPTDGRTIYLSGSYPSSFEGRYRLGCNTISMGNSRVYAGAINSGKTICGVLFGASIYLGFLNGMDATNAPELKDEGRLKAIKSVNELFNGFINQFAETDCTALTGCDWSKKEDINATSKMKFIKTPVFGNLNMSLKNALLKRQWQINKEGKFYMIKSYYDLISSFALKELYQ